MIEVLKAYLQVAGGVGDLTRQRALEAARQALAATPASAVLPVASAGVDGLAAQASALADELLAAGRANREMLGHLVRAEVETVVSRLGLDGRSDLEAELATSRSRVRELERNLAAARAGRATPTKGTAKRATTAPAASRRTAKRASATTATAKTATATTAKTASAKTAKTAKTATAKTATTAKKATATTARTATAKTAKATPRTAATKRTTKRSSASKATSA